MVWPWYKQTWSSCMGLWVAAVSFLPCEVQSECWSLDPQPKSAKQIGEGRGERGEGTVAWGVLPVELRVKGGPGRANWDGELTLKMCSLDGCTVCFKPAFCSRDRSPLLLICLSACGSFSLSLSHSPSFHSVSSLPICMWFRQRLRGEASPLGEWNQSREGGREREEVCLFYRTQPGPGRGAVPHLEVKVVEQGSQRE